MIPTSNGSTVSEMRVMASVGLWTVLWTVLSVNLVGLWTVLWTVRMGRSPARGALVLVLTRPEASR